MMVNRLIEYGLPHYLSSWAKLAGVFPQISASLQPSIEAPILPAICPLIA